MDLINNEEIEQKIILVSEELREFLNIKWLVKQDELAPIYEEDIDKLLERIERTREVRKDEILISAEIALEFIYLVKDKIKEKNQHIGILLIDIGGKDFSVKDFIDKTKDISYGLKLKILSIKDLKKEEIRFLKKRPKIRYQYAEDEYSLEELFDIVDKMKKLVKKNERKIRIPEKNLERASAIANLIFQHVELYVPLEYVNPYKGVISRSGELLTLPNIRIVENTTHFAKLPKILNGYKNIADYNGMRKLCKECLRNDGYQMVERVASIGNTVGIEMIIDNKEYGIEVTKEGMNIVEIK